MRWTVCFLTCAALASSALAQCGVQRQRIVSPEGSGPDAFGFDVARNGAWAVIGASGDDNVGLNAGAAWLYNRDLGVWIENDKFYAATGSDGDRFGQAVAISGETAAFSSPYDAVGAVQKAGSVAVYVMNRAGGWVQQATLTASDAATNDSLGWSIALEGDVLVAGAPAKNVVGTDSGAVYVFRRSGTTWAQEQRLTPGDGEVFKFFGESVGLQGDTIAIGAWGDSALGEGAGCVYLFQRIAGTWVESGKLLAADAQAGDNLGKRVALRGNTLVAVADAAFTGGPSYGAAYIFRRDAGGAWSQQAKLTPEGAEQDEAFGVSVTTDQGLVVVGASWQDPKTEVESRWAYVFREEAGAWPQAGRIQPAPPVQGEIFGYHAAMEGDRVLVAAFDKISGGAAYEFNLSGCNVCYPDCNADGARNLADFGCFQTKFALGDPYADCNGDQVLNLADFGCFQTKFALGCP